MQVLRGRVVTPGAVIADGAVAISGNEFTYVGPWRQAPGAVLAQGALGAPSGYLLPGLVDIHNHGAMGVSFPDITVVSDVEIAVAEHTAHGTAHLLGSLVTAEVETLRRQVALLAEAADEGLIAGIHLEGPFISRARRGAQNPAHIIAGDPDLTRELIRLGRGHVRTMTLAPETPELRGVLAVLADGGVVPSFGHTDADEACMREAIDHAGRIYAGTGRRATVTHLFNGMRPIHHRDPGPVPPALAAAARGEVVVELIGDGVHLHPGIVTDVFAMVGAENIALVTDAMAATGKPDGRYRLGGLDVVVSGGVARLAGGDSLAGGESLAGGTAHLLDVIRTTVAGGVEVVDAVRSASVVPAQVIDPSARFGALRPGYAAHVVCVDETFRIRGG